MRSTILTLVAALLLVAPASADVFADNTGAENDGGDLGQFFADQGFFHLDLASLEITNDLSDISFTFNINANINGGSGGTDWGKYMVVIDSVPAAGATGHENNAWYREFEFTRGTDYTIPGWVDGGGGSQLWSWNGGGWDQLADPATMLTDTSVTYTVPLANMGLTPGDVIWLDGISTAGGDDPAVDAISSDAVIATAWDSDSVVEGFAYTLVPEPASLLALVLLGALRRR
jgi:hypothetical protein